MDDYLPYVMPLKLCVSGKFLLLLLFYPDWKKLTMKCFISDKL